MPHPVRWLFVFGVLCIYLFGCTVPSNSGCVDLGSTKCGSTKNPVVFPTPVPTTLPPTTPSLLSPLSVKLSTVWETGSSGNKFESLCEVPAGSPVGTQKICTISVPEAQLYYSDINLQLSAAEGKCDLVRFLPYYYRASESANFVPEWGTSTINCSGENKECYSGAATELVSDFPTHRGLIYFPGLTSFSQSWTAHAAHAKKRLSNRWISNGIGASLRGSNLTVGTSGDGFVANSIQDWHWMCFDAENVEQYRVSLVVLPKTTSAIKGWEVAQPLGGGGPSPTSPMSLSISSTWEGGASGATNIINSKCEVVAGSVAGTQQSCTLSVPEGQLYFSDFEFNLNVQPGVCDIVKFNPYYYKASNTASFLPEWSPSTAVNCTLNDPKCYSGPATEIVPSFPTYTSLLYFPGQAALSKNWTAHSSHSQNRFSNRWMSNTLAAGSRSFAISTFPGDGYVASSMQDWAWSCMNSSNVEIYRVNLTLQPSSTVFYPAWEGAPTAPTIKPPMTLEITTQWEDDTYNTHPAVKTTCEAPSSSIGTTTQCNVNIEEGQLYYSRMIFKLDIPSNTCDIVEFTPYHYQAGNTATFKPQWNIASDLDCTGATNPILPVGCYDGPATHLVPGFPFYFGLVYFPASADFTRSWLANSAHESIRGNNRWGSNMLTAANRGSATIGGYVPNSMIDYSATCLDKFHDLQYEILVTVTDTDGPAGNQIGTWGGF